MPFVTGTSTDYKDLLNDLRDYIISAPAGSDWVVERDTSGGSPTQVEMIFKGNGGATEEIFWGIETYFDGGVGYYNWRLRGFTGFDTTLSFDNQPGTSGDSYIPLQNEQMTYWFFVTGRRVCMVVKTGSAYQFLYAGFIDQYATPDEYPYPLLVMGSSYLSTVVFNSNLIAYASSVNPGTGNLSSAPAYLRDPAGAWLKVINFTAGSTESRIGSSPGTAQVWPLCGKSTTNIPTASQSYHANTLESRFSVKSQGGSPALTVYRSVNGTATNVAVSIPTVLLAQDPAPQHYGEIHNLYWSPLVDGVSAEDTVTDAVSGKVHRVFQNTHRTDPWCGILVTEE